MAFKNTPVKEKATTEENAEPRVETSRPDRVHAPQFHVKIPHNNVSSGIQSLPPSPSLSFCERG